MLHAEGNPCLTIKAWNGRLMLIFLDQCLATYIKGMHDAGSPVAVEVLNTSVATRAMAAWFDSVERSGRILSPSEARSIYNFGMTFLKAYHRLGVQAAVTGSRRWKFIPKLHVVHHLCENAVMYGENPRFVHCFRDEDHVGLIKRLAVRVHKGPLFEYRILTRWLLRLDTWHP